MLWFSIYGVLQVSLIILHHGCPGEAGLNIDKGDSCSDLKSYQSDRLSWCTNESGGEQANSQQRNKKRFISDCNITVFCASGNLTQQSKCNMTSCPSKLLNAKRKAKYCTHFLKHHEVIDDIMSLTMLKGQEKLEDDRAEAISCGLNNIFDDNFIDQWMRSNYMDRKNIFTVINRIAFKIDDDFRKRRRNNIFSFEGSNFGLIHQRFRPHKGRLKRKKYSSDEMYKNSSLKRKASIEIPYSALCDDSNNCSVIVGVSIVNNLAKYIHGIIENSTNRSIASVLLSAYAEVNVERLKDNPIVMSFQLNTSHLEFDDDDAMLYECVFLDMNNFMWNTSGVKTGIPYEDRINCTSTHLTSFAVLVSVNPVQAPEGERFALKVVSYIGCAVSIVCLIATITLLILLRKKMDKGVLLYIHLNLSFSLLLALLVFVAGLETATSIPVLCIIISALIQYFFMCTFFWMLGEGIMLYLLIVRVFGKLHTRWYLLLPFCWGFPLVIVSISAGVLRHDYHTTSYCWIKADPTKPAIWIFIVPMIIIILINSLILARTVYAIVRGKKNGGAESEVKNTGLVKTAIKSSVILMPLLGLTWIVGLFAVNENTTVFAWLFTILNSFQGLFIFLMHIMRSSAVYKAIKNCFALMKPISSSLKSSDAKTSEALAVEGVQSA